MLEPFEVTEAAEVTSVLLEASVQDKTGRFVKGLPPTQFSVLENDVPQKLDIVRQEAVGATFALLIDSSQSMSRRMDFVQRTAATLSELPVAARPDDRRAVLAGVGAGHRADQRSRRRSCEGIEAIQPGGGTAILDSLVAGRAQPRRTPRAAARSC